MELSCVVLLTVLTSACAEVSLCEATDVTCNTDSTSDSEFAFLSGFGDQWGDGCSSHEGGRERQGWRWGDLDGHLGNKKQWRKVALVEKRQEESNRHPQMKMNVSHPPLTLSNEEKADKVPVEFRQRVQEDGKDPWVKVQRECGGGGKDGKASSFLALFFKRGSFIDALDRIKFQSCRNRYNTAVSMEQQGCHELHLVWYEVPPGSGLQDYLSRMTSRGICCLMMTRKELFSGVKSLAQKNKRSVPMEGNDVGQPLPCVDENGLA